MMRVSSADGVRGGPRTLSKTSSTSNAGVYYCAADMDVREIFSGSTVIMLLKQQLWDENTRKTRFLFTLGVQRVTRRTSMTKCPRARTSQCFLYL